jgi:hypothetical protein
MFKREIYNRSTGGLLPFFFIEYLHTLQQHRAGFKIKKGRAKQPSYKGSLYIHQNLPLLFFHSV